jgi:hypothetical protein
VILLHEIVHSEVNAHQLPPWNGKISGHECTCSDYDGVEATAQFVPADVVTYVYTHAELRAFCAHLPETIIDRLFFQFEIRDTVSEQAANSIVPFIHRDRVPRPRELLGGRQSGWTGAHDRNGLSREPFGWVGLYPVARPRLVDDGLLNQFDRHRLLADPENTRTFARCRTQSTGEFGKVVGRVQALTRFTILAAPHEVIPLWDEVSKGATLMAERNPTVHAPAGLTTEDGIFARLVDLFPVE